MIESPETALQSSDTPRPKRGRPPKDMRVGLSNDHIPTSPQYALGIDIGVDGFHVCTACSDVDAEKWPVWFVSYKDTPRWRDVLRNMLGKDTICVAEPTGWNYLSPVARVITTQSPAHLYMIEHSKTGAVRTTLNITQKTDVNDARALASVAWDLHGRPRVAGAWRFDWTQHEQLLELRFLVNAHYKAGADKTRFSNRLKHLGHSIDPCLNFGTAWRVCMEMGLFTPDEILAIDLKEVTGSGSRRKAIRHLQERLTPDTVVSDALVTALRETYSNYFYASLRLNDLEQAIVERVLVSDWRYLFDRWMTVPLASAVGCAALIVASKGKADQLSYNVFKATLGAYPQIKESGKIRKSRAAKRGYRPAMKAVHMWAQLLVREDAPNTIIKTYFGGGEKNGGRKFTATKARLARVLHGVAKSPDGYYGALAQSPIDGDRKAENMTKDTFEDA
jgi:hypothetical protein